MTSAVAAEDDAPAAGTRRRRWRERPPLVIWVGITAIAFIERIPVVGHGVVTVDEPTWMARSQAWFTALTHGHLSRMTVPIATPKTRPGVTTMWIGSVAAGITLLAHKVGLVDGITTPFERSSFGLGVAQVLMAVVCAGLIGLVAVLAARLFGQTVGLVAGGLVSIEPFLIGHTSVLHTDGLLTLFLVTSALALMVALRLGTDDDPSAPFLRRWFAIAGVLAGLALLTKVSAPLYFPGLLVPVAFAVGRRRAAGGRPGAELARGLGVLVGAAAATTVVLWPALWVDPVRQVQALIDSARLGETGHPTFFRGRTTTEPGPWYYLVVIPLRASPALLLGSVAGIATLTVRRARSVVAVIALLPVPYLVAISLSTKQFDRYALPVLVTMALLAAVAAVDIMRWVGRQMEARYGRADPFLIRVAGIVLVVLFVLPTNGASQRYPLAYFDPLAGGAHRAERTILVGWGEGLEQVGRAITRDRDGECDGVVTAVPAIHNYISFPCGVIVPLRARVYKNLSDVTYAVDSISEDQRATKTHRDYFALVRQQGTLIKTVRIQGLVYARLYRIDHPPPGACKDDLMAVPYAPRCG